MNEQELVRALQDLIRQRASEPDTWAREMSLIGRDKWRVRLFASLSILFWLLGVAGLILLVVGLDRLVIGIRTADVQGLRGVHGTSLLHHSIPIILGSVAALLLGAIFTLVLFLTSRRATLRQINMSLAKLAQQISDLQHQTTAHDVQTPAGAFQVHED